MLQQTGGPEKVRKGLAQGVASYPQKGPDRGAWHIWFLNPSS